MSSLSYKLLALLFMLIDHIGFLLLPDIFLLRVIGRLAMPLFAFQFSIGIKNTKNIKNRIFKLLIFAILVQIPYSIFYFEAGVKPDLNIIFTFLLSTLIIFLINTAKEKNNFDFRAVTGIIIAVILLSSESITKVDYGFYGVLLPVIFYYTSKSKTLMPLFYYIIWLSHLLISRTLFSVLGIVTLAEIPLFFIYNGKKGYKNGTAFYFIYFAHFIALLFIKALIS